MGERKTILEMQFQHNIFSGVVLMLMLIVTGVSGAAPTNPSTVTTGKPPSASIHTRKTSSSAALTPPPLSYTCNTGGQINIDASNLGGYSRMAIQNTPGLQNIQEQFSNGNQLCKRELRAISSNASIQLSNCKMGTPIYIYIMKEKKTKVYGGRDFHEYILSCNLPADGVTAYVSLAAPIKASLSTTPSPQSQAPSIKVHMEISPDKNIQVGQNLQLKISLNSTLWVLPESCDAFPGAASSGDSITLLRGSKTQDSELMSNFSVTAGNATADIYAFRFVDSPSVMIRCLVHLCKDKSCNSTFNSYVTTPSSRKRRAAEKTLQQPKSDTHVVTAMFTIEDGKKTTSGQSAVFYSVITMMVMLKLQHIMSHQE